MNYVSEEDYLTVFVPYWLALLDVKSLSSHLCYSGFSYALFKNSLDCIFYIKIYVGPHRNNRKICRFAQKLVMFANVHWSYGLGKCQNLLVTDVYGKQTIEQLRNSHLNHLVNCNLFLNHIHLFSWFPLQNQNVLRFCKFKLHLFYQLLYLDIFCTNKCFMHYYKVTWQADIFYVQDIP